MKKVLLILISYMVFIPNVYAHKANVNGYQDKNSNKISYCNKKYYGFHKQNGKYHYHEVKWEESWKIVSDEVIDKNPCGNNNERIEVTFSACIDGDTAKFNYKNEVIVARFLGIDTPESVHPTKEVQMYGKEASEYTCTSLKNAKKIELEFDTGSDKYDKYNRYLVWVFIDGNLLQENLIEEGYAKVYYIYGNYKYTDMLKEKESIAKNNKLRIWSLDSNSSSSELIVDNEEDRELYLLLIIVSVMVFILGKPNVKMLKKLLKKIKS